MELAARLDEYGKFGWIAVIVLGFMVWWPIGLAILAYAIWSGRMGCWGRGGPGRWYHAKESGEGRRGWRRHRGPSGNAAFDEYREETLRRLEEEQEEFEQFLHRLRQAKDKAEFDQFMRERRDRGSRPDDTAGEAGSPSPSPAG